jgi:hypothetical protein
MIGIQCLLEIYWTRLHRIGPAKIKFEKEENLTLPALWFLRTSERTPFTTIPPRKNHHLRSIFSPTTLKNACKNNKKPLPARPRKNSAKSPKIPRPNPE